LRLIGAVTLLFVLLSSMFSGAHAEIHLSKATDAMGEDISGDGQVGVVMRELSRPLVIFVSDDEGRAVPDVYVQFEVAAEPVENFSSVMTARIVTPDVVSDVRGYARTDVITGGVPGEYHFLATSPESDSQVHLSVKVFQRYWGLFLAFGLIGGLALFLFGLRYCSQGLSRMAGNRLRGFLWSVTGNRFLGLLVGVMITVMLQSSSATTVMLVSFANAGLMNLMQSLGVILGADVGTTLTVQLIAFKLTDYAILVVALGFFLMVAFRKRQSHNVGRVIFGFGLVFYGMKVMSDTVVPLKFYPPFLNLMAGLASAPLVALLLGLIFTALVQSSAATIGVILMLGFQGLVDLRMAVAFMLGANIGTCATALIATIGGGTEARRIAWAHTLFKVIIVLLFIPFLDHFVRLSVLSAASLSRQIANAHAMVNAFAAILFLPFLGPYAWLVRKLISPDVRRERELHAAYLDDRMLSAPDLALGQACREVLRMADITSGMLRNAWEMFSRNDDELRMQLIKEDDRVDQLRSEIVPFLTKIYQEELSQEQSIRALQLLHVVDELEHIGDIVSKNLVRYAQKKIEEGFYFSEAGFHEIHHYHELAVESVQMAISALAGWDQDLAARVVKRRETVNLRLRELRNAHVERLKMGMRESLETSAVHLDLISDLERINTHAANIGAAILGEM
jgi:phosphate:Na+ symporter